VFSGRGIGNSVIKRQLEDLKVGEVVTGQVVHIVDYGAFVNIGGVDGLVHISELDWNEVEHPSDILDVGDEVQVLIQDVDVERERISLSRKELLPSPWDGVEDKFVIGEIVEGTVIKVLDFGAFVRLSDGIVGLIHESELGIEGPLSPRDAVQNNEVVMVKILSIDAERRRMSLTLQVAQDEELDPDPTPLGTMGIEAGGP
jgi:small subunit ribosomal protein S1